jgi:hypothetical protein
MSVRGENSTTLLQYAVAALIPVVATGCHSMFISLVTHWKCVPSFNHETVNDVRVGSLLLRLCYATSTHRASRSWKSRNRTPKKFLTRVKCLFVERHILTF